MKKKKYCVRNTDFEHLNFGLSLAPDTLYYSLLMENNKHFQLLFSEPLAVLLQKIIKPAPPHSAALGTSLMCDPQFVRSRWADECDSLLRLCLCGSQFTGRDGGMACVRTQQQQQVWQQLSSNCGHNKQHQACAI